MFTFLIIKYHQMVFLHMFKRSCKVSENLIAEAGINEKQNISSLMFSLENFTLLLVWQLLQIFKKVMESLILVNASDLPLHP